jgi:succinoglycan biosynthesis transport protein ExoP
VFLLLLLDRLDDRLNSFSEVTDLFEEDVLGQILREETLDSRGQMSLLQPHYERHSFLEGYPNLRASLLYMFEPGKRPKTILVTSSVPNDGLAAVLSTQIAALVIQHQA